MITSASPSTAGIMLLLLASAAAAVPATDSDLKTAWKEVVSTKPGRAEWGSGALHERRGQICDPHRSFGQPPGPVAEDDLQGCAVVFIADPQDQFTVKQLPANQQNNFQNTQHYKAAWNFDRKGFQSESLPRAGKDMDPVCYVANVSGTIVLGYEEGNGDRLLPCPGNDAGFPFTEEEIMAPDADLEDMCSMCYTAVCRFSRNPESCGGGVEIAKEADIVKQAGPAYHCHLTMANEGACDYVQYDQHEESREYYMDYSVMCGWEGIREYNLTQCDCTAQAGQANNCQRNHCLTMASTAGVVCGNCGGCSRSRSYSGIFEPPHESDVYAGQCAKAMKASNAADKEAAKMMCSAGLFCRRHQDGARQEDLGSSGCQYHCDTFPNDPKCTESPEEAQRRSLPAEPAAPLTGSRKMLSYFGLVEPSAGPGAAGIDFSAVHPDFPVIVSKPGTPHAKGYVPE